MHILLTVKIMLNKFAYLSEKNSANFDFFLLELFMWWMGETLDAEAGGEDDPLEEERLPVRALRESMV